MFDKFIELMREELSGFSTELSEYQLYQFYQYLELLMEWNKVMNLAIIMELEDVATKHFVDSLSLVRAVPDLSDEKILDMGTGAGFSGIPLKIAFPESKITLLDSLNKRINSLNEMIGQLQLGEIQVIHGQAEDYGGDRSYREQYNYCVFRTVANLSTLSEYHMPYVKIGGAFIPYKSERTEEELSQAKGAAKPLGGKIEEAVIFVFPETDVERSFVIIRETEGTSKRHSRKAGLPSKEPLK